MCREPSEVTTLSNNKKTELSREKFSMELVRLFISGNVEIVCVCERMFQHT